MSMISIIVPVFNSEKYLYRCISSLLSQSYRDYEILLIDDGSTDNSGCMCDDLALKDNRIRVYHQENQGQASARNLALDVAKGDYIGFVDSDDYIHPQMIEVLLTNAKKTNAQVSVGGCRTVVDYNLINSISVEKCEGTLWKGKEFLTHCLLDRVEKKPWVLWDKLFHRSCFDGMRLPEGRIYEDNAVVYRILYEAERVVDCNIPLYYYFQNVESTVNQAFNKKHLDWLLVPQEMIDYFEAKKDAVLWDKANVMYLNALVDSYQNVKTHLNDPIIENKLKKQLQRQLQHEKARYSISITSHPHIYESLYPHRMYIYCTLKGIRNKFRRKNGNS